MKKLAFALLMAAASLAPAAVINVEFKFTPFVGNPAKDEKVTTVPGKADVFINNVPFAEQDVQKENCRSSSMNTKWGPQFGCR